MINPKKTGLEPYRAVLKDEEPKKKTSQSGAKAPLTVDQREQKELTYLEQTYGEAAKRDAAAHQTAVKAQETARQSANRQAYIGSELMAKYLPQYQAMQGTGGMGTSQTDAAAAMNAYFGQVSENNAGYAENVAALEQAKAERDAQRESELRDKRYDAMSRYDYERQQMAEEESTGLLGLMSGRADGYYGADGKISTEDYKNLLAFYTTNEDRLTEAGKRNAQDMLAEYKLAIRDAEEQAAVDRMGFIDGTARVTSAPSKYEPEKNFEVTDSKGRTFRVQIAGEVTDEAIKAEASKADSGEVFGYGGKMYIKNYDKVYEVEARTNFNKGDYASLYDLYFGQGQGVEQNKVTVGTLDDRGTITVRDTPRVYKAGNNFTVQNGEGRIYDVQIAGVLQHSSKDAEAIEKMETGKVYPYAGTLVVKSPEGKLYKVEKRTLQSNKKSDYTDLYRLYYQ
jgi:hypothetical protein